MIAERTAVPSHFIHYWAYPRAAIAFDGMNAPVVSLENGWFKSLTRGDIVWILTRWNSQPYLVLRFVVEATKSVKRHPAYAIRNSSYFTVTKAISNPQDATPPHAIQFDEKILSDIRFDARSRSDRVTMQGHKIYEHDLAAMRRLAAGSESILESIWNQGKGSFWNADNSNIAETTGFASDPLLRKEIEQAAISAVTHQLQSRGWNVESRELDCVGYDLECTKKDKLMLVEVKGSSGESSSFIMTRGEYLQARTRTEYCVAIVHNAISNPRIQFVSQADLLDKYAFEPLSFTVSQIPKK